MGKWLNLTAKLKAQVIQFAILNGVSNIKDIRDTFNIYANGGDTLAYNKFVESLPDNQSGTDTTKYDMYRYWELNGRPKDFEEAKQRGMFHKESDGYYHASTLAEVANSPDKHYGTLEFIKAKNHNTIGLEVGAYLKDKNHPMRNKEYILDYTGDKARYRPRTYSESVLPEGAYVGNIPITALYKNGGYLGHWKDGTLEGESLELAMARINKEKEKERVEYSKNWLAEWYENRLPVIGKEHLQTYVDKGLETQYLTPSLKQLTDPKDFIVLNKGVLGQYVKPMEPAKTSYGFSGTLWPRIALNSIWDGTPVHEFNHAIHFGGGSSFIPDFTNGKTSTYDAPYLSYPWELHSRIMELRFLNRLDPLKTNYNIEDLNALRERMRLNATIIQELKNGGMTDLDIINALNTWASNTTNPFETENGMLAAFGGHLNSTGGPLYPFSFEKNPFLKTPVVRYDEGGMLGHLYRFGDWLKNLFGSKKELPVEKMTAEEIKEDRVNRFIEDIWETEYAVPRGYDPIKGLYFPYDSPEGGTKTIGPGFKLREDGSGDATMFSVKEAEKGVTREQIDKKLLAQGNLLYDKVFEFLNQKGNRLPVDTINPNIMNGLMDLRFLVGGLGGWNKLREAVLNGDLEGIKNESKTYYTAPNGKIVVDTRRNNLRAEKYWHYD